MSEPAKNPGQQPESYQPSKPEMMKALEEAQGQATEAFVRKNAVEMIELHEDIQVVGFSYDKCRRTGSVKLSSKFDLYQRNPSQENIKNVTTPITVYAVYIHERAGDMIYGMGVTDISGQDELYGSCTIPAGRYMKVSWNAETFSELVMEAMENARERAGVDAFMAKHNLVRDNALNIEVYPHERMCVGRENGPDWALAMPDDRMTPPITKYPEMYTLTTVKDVGAIRGAYIRWKHRQSHARFLKKQSKKEGKTS